MKNCAWLMTVVLGVFLCSSSACAASAEGVYVPPPTAKALDQTLYPLDKQIVDSYLARVPVSHVFDEFAGQNDALTAEAKQSKPLEVAVGFPLDMASEALFGQPVQDEDWNVYLAAVTSVDALAIRLQVDLSQLAEGEEVWVLDPDTSRAFGPYKQEDAVDGGRWLATILTDTAVLMARTQGEQMPQVRLTGLSHFYRSLQSAAFEGPKILDCNINVACETDAAIQEASSAVGLVVVTLSSFSSLSGSGSLINNAETPELEPYLITANHVIGSQANVTNTEVFWDFRSSSCSEDNSPARTEVPRSDGDELLATNADLDATLISLASVPIGAYGRAYLGYDTRTPEISEDVLVMHHPQGSHMRISYGKVKATNQSSALGYSHQVKIGWDEGVTEGGSSGSTFLYANSLCIGGALSNGPTHVCGAGPTVNFDRFSSFRHFYEDISPEFFPGDDDPELQCNGMLGATGSSGSGRRMADALVCVLLLSSLLVSRRYRRGPIRSN